MGLFPTGVAIVTCGAGEDTQAVTASSLISVSLDPLLMLISIRGDGKIRFAIEQSGKFAVNFLHQGHDVLSARFASHDRPTGHAAMSLLGETVGQTGNTLLANALASLECEVDAQHHGGDHELFIGRVVAISFGDQSLKPLLSHRGHYSSPA
jgi:3-hydroxy-9,10-secoandrosta-1,3,5(10)-triene-9,17-dione monooxygenase reductase component